MKPSLANQRDYEAYLYALPSLHPEIENSTITLLPIRI